MYKYHYCSLMTCLVFLLSLSFNVQAALIIPTDDAFVIKTEPDTPYGSDRILTWTAYMSGGRGRSYVKFPLSGLPDSSQIASATLNMYQYDAGGFVPYVNIYHVADDNWTEDSITWNTMPNYAGQIIRENIGFGVEWISFDLLSSGVWDYDSDLNDGYVSLLIKSDETGDERHNFYSKEEDIEGNFQPYLEVVLVPEPSTIGLILLGGLLLKRR